MAKCIAQNAVVLTTPRSAAANHRTGAWIAPQRRKRIEQPKTRSRPPLPPQSPAWKLSAGRTILYYTILYYTILYCTVLYYTGRRKGTAISNQKHSCGSLLSNVEAAAWAARWCQTALRVRAWLYRAPTVWPYMRACVRNGFTCTDNTLQHVYLAATCIFSDVWYRSTVFYLHWFIINNIYIYIYIYTYIYIYM